MTVLRSSLYSGCFGLLRRLNREALCVFALSLLAFAPVAASPSTTLSTAKASAKPEAQTEAGPDQDILDKSGLHPSIALSAAPFTLVEMARFNQPWAMTFLPASLSASRDSRSAASTLLIAEKGGRLILWQETQRSKQRNERGIAMVVSGVPSVADGGQGGLGDVIAAPDFATSNRIYLSWVEASGDGTWGAVVGHAVLDHVGSSRSPAKPTLRNLQIIWRQSPKVTGRGHFAHRLAFSPDGEYLFITSGDRQKFDPAQDMSGNLGKIIRLRPNGSIPTNNPFVAEIRANKNISAEKNLSAEKFGISAQIWSLGHRNPLGIAFDGEGRLWEHEMGPRGGDEVNLIVRGANYGYPSVSNGDHYDGRNIPDHDTDSKAKFKAPVLWWNPSISPSGLVWYGFDRYPGWKNSLLLGALSGRSLIRLSLRGSLEQGKVHKAERWNMRARIREVEVRDDGIIWLLTDGRSGALVKLVPKI